MRGSLGIWIDDAGNAEAAPLLDMHFNIWCDLPKHSPDVLDIGLAITNGEAIRALHVYIPGPVTKELISDLAPNLADPKPLSAVFNDTVSIVRSNDTVAEIKRSNGTIFNILRLSVSDHISVKTIGAPARPSGTVISFAESLFRGIAANREHYIRFRIQLKGLLAKLFVTDSVPIDRIVTSSFFRTEIIEFRVNEKRNFDEALRREFPGMKMPSVRAIHLFLVRDLRVELVRSHADFRKMRRLEPGLWESYLEPFGDIRPEDMIIYHWRDVGQPVEDFVALSMFRKTRKNLLLFLSVIVVLGAMGSAAQSGLLDTMQAWISQDSLQSVSTLMAQGPFFLAFLPEMAKWLTEDVRLLQHLLVGAVLVVVLFLLYVVALLRR